MESSDSPEAPDSPDSPDSPKSPDSEVSERPSRSPANKLRDVPIEAVAPSRRDPSTIADIDRDLVPDPSVVELDDDGRYSPTWWQSGLALVAIGGTTALAAWAGSRATRRSIEHWYEILEKPGFTPPRAVFGPVWTGLYALNAASAYRVWKAPPSRERTVALVLWGAQMVLNGLWSPLFFGQRRPGAALVDLVGLGIGATAYAAAARRVDPGAAKMVIPYLGWIGFAGALNEEIVRRNHDVLGHLRNLETAA